MRHHCRLIIAASLPSYCGTCHLINAASLPSAYRCGIIANLSLWDLERLWHHRQLVFYTAHYYCAVVASLPTCIILLVIKQLRRHRRNLLYCSSLSSCGIIADLWLNCHIPTPVRSCCSFNEAVRDQLVLFAASSLS
jgi:hypothetical protein